jgi:nucleoside-diphosphate-sugar epimerase
MRILVTGASSLLGGAVVRALRASGHDVVAMQRRPSGIGCPEVLGDITDAQAAARAVVGAEAVVHLAAKVNVVGADEEFRRVNVTGTRNLLAAAQAAGVTRFVQVSSPSVAHSGSALAGVGAEPANPVTARGAYSRTKAEAEVLALAEDRPGFAVTAIRPHLVWGPGDEQLIGRIVARARSHRLFLIGHGTALIDTTYVDNAADALVAAVEWAGDPLVHGKAFVVSNGQPRTVSELLTRIASAAGLPGPTRSVPFAAARTAGLAAERAWALRSRDGRVGEVPDPPLTSFLAEQLSTAHWFDQRSTRTALRWAPAVPLEEGFARLESWFAVR